MSHGSPDLRRSGPKVMGFQLWCPLKGNLSVQKGYGKEFSRTSWDLGVGASTIARDFFVKAPGKPASYF